MLIHEATPLINQDTLTGSKGADIFVSSFPPPSRTCRAMEFVQHFIAEVSGGEHSLDVAAGKAYGLSLRRYHGWIVRGVFNVSHFQ